MIGNASLHCRSNAKAFMNPIEVIIDVVRYQSGCLGVFSRGEKGNMETEGEEIKN